MRTRNGTQHGTAAAFVLASFAVGTSVGCGSLLGYEGSYETRSAAGAAGSGSGAASGGGSAGAAGGSGESQGGASGSPAGGASGAAGAAGSSGGEAGAAGASGGTGQGGQAAQAGAGGAAGMASGGGAGGAGAAGAAGGGTAGAAGAAGGACPILYVAPAPSSGAGSSADGCSSAAPITDVTLAFAKASTVTGLEEIRLCGITHVAKAGLTLPANVSLRGGYDCGTWQLPNVQSEVNPSEISFSGEKPSTLLRVPPGSPSTPPGTGSVTIEHVSLLGASGPGEAPRTVPVIGLELSGGSPLVRYVRVEPPSAKVADPTMPFAAVGIAVGASVQATVEHATVTQSRSELATGFDGGSAGVGVAVEKDGKLIISDSTVVSADNRSSGTGSSSVALIVQPGATANVQGGSFRARLGYSIDVKSSIVTGGIIVASGGALIMRGALVMAESGSAGPDDGTPSKANTVGVGGDLFSTLVIDASRVIADGAQGNGTSVALAGLGASITATSSIFFGGSSGTAAATSGVSAAGKLSFEHCTIAAGRPRAGMPAIAIQMGEPLNGALMVHNSLLLGDTDRFSGLALVGACSIASGEISNTAIALVGSQQLLGGGLVGGAACAGSPYSCLADLEAVFPKTGLTKNNQVFSMKGVPVCGSSGGTQGSPICGSPNACLDAMFPDYSEADGGVSSAQAGKGFMPRVCPLVRGGAPSAVTTDLDGAPRTPTRPTVGALQASFTYVALCP